MSANVEQRAPFRLSYPIDFELHDDDYHSYLAIDDPHSLNLTIANRSGYAIELQPLNGTSPSAEHHHFELRFRLRTLSQQAMQMVELATAGWTMSQAQINADRTVSLYFLAHRTMTLSPQEPIRLRLENLSADDNAGARGTRVELRYRNLRFAGHETPLVGQRQIHLNIIHASGRKLTGLGDGEGELPPMHVGFVGAPMVINDGERANSLLLRIANATNTTDINLTGHDAASPSRFVLSFDSGDTDKRHWALGTQSEVTAIVPRFMEPERMEPELIEVAPEPHAPDDVTHGWCIRQDIQGESPEWIITPASDTTFAPGDAIALQLDNIITAHPSGRTNLYLRYENIPGYADSEVVIPIEKAPLRYEPDGTVYVQEYVNMRSEASIYDALSVGNGAEVCGGATVYGGLTVNDRTTLSDALLFDNPKSNSPEEHPNLKKYPHGTIYGNNRIRIYGEEELYLLNKNGVIVGKSWNGNGNLTVEGRTTLKDTVEMQSSATVNGGITGNNGLTVNNGATINGDVLFKGSIGDGSGRQHLKLHPGGTLYSSAHMHIFGESELYLLNRNGVVVGKHWHGNGNLTVQGYLMVDNVPKYNEDDDYDLTWNPGNKRISCEMSSVRYKDDVQPLEDDFEKVLALEPKQYRMREGYGTTERTQFGYLAEDLDALGLGRLVIYDRDGQPDGIRYKKLALYAVEVLKHQQAQIDDLTARLEQLEARLGAIEASSGITS